MRTVSVPSLLMCVAIAATAAKLPAQQGVLNMSAANQDCPVDFSLEKNSHNGAVSPAQAGRQTSAVTAKRSVQATLSARDGKNITDASITVYAPRISNRATPAKVIFGQTAEPDLVTKTYHLAQDKTAKGPLIGDLELLDTMAGVESASIKSVTYADGATWRPVNGAACVAAPQSFTQIAGR
jgi:hypothetical protein